MKDRAALPVRVQIRPILEDGLNFSRCDVFLNCADLYSLYIGRTNYSGSARKLRAQMKEDLKRALIK